MLFSDKPPPSVCMCMCMCFVNYDKEQTLLYHTEIKKKHQTAIPKENKNIL
jgi:hypothetical protein